MCFGRPRDVGLDAGRGELALQRGDDGLDVALAVEPALVEHLRDRLVLVGLECAQRQVFELPLQLPDAEAVGERGEEVEHFARRVAAQAHVAGHQEAQRLRALGELDQHDADVLDHRQQHLAQALRLRGALVGIARVGKHPDFVHPRDTRDQRGGVGAESRADVVGVERVRGRAVRSAAPRARSWRRASVRRGSSRCRWRAR